MLQSAGGMGGGGAAAAGGVRIFFLPLPFHKIKKLTKG